MNKELEYIQRHIDIVKQQIKGNRVKFIVTDTVTKHQYDYYENELQTLESIENALQRLESIDNANPSEALEILETLADDGLLNKEIGAISYNQIWLKNQIEILQQALQSINLLMQELGCKDMETLRKYARCGYEKINKKDLHLERVEE